MAFEKYSGARKTSRGPLATIRKTGQIVFNSAAAREMKIVDQPAVSLYYDKDTNVIGVKAESDSKAQGARKLGKLGQTRTISASSFIHFFGIALKKNIKIVPSYDKKKDLILLDLKKTVRGASRRGRRKNK